MPKATIAVRSAAAVRHNGGGWVFNTVLLILAGLVLCLISYLKSYAASDLLFRPFPWSFVVLLTLYRLSRIPCAMFYERSYGDVLAETQSGHDDAHPYEPTVSFVIPCKNEEAAIYHTIVECYGVDYPKDKLSVIVINDGSTDNTLQVLLKAKEEFPDLVIVDWKKNRGKRHGMAEGFRQATGDIVVQLDSDSYMDRSTFRELVRPFANACVGAVCAHADPANSDRNWVTKMQAAYYFLSFRILKAAESTFDMVLCCSGCSSAYRRSAVIPIVDAFLAETFLGLPVTWGDDRALTNWMLKLNLKTLYSKQTKAWTIVPETLRGFIKQQIRWKKGWFVNSLFATRFIHRQSVLVALTHFYPLLLTNAVIPFIWVSVLVGVVWNFHLFGFMLYSAGLFLVFSIFVLYYRWLDRSNKYWPYLFVWGAFSSLLSCWLMVYALATIQNRKWGTR